VTEVTQSSQLSDARERPTVRVAGLLVKDQRLLLVRQQRGGEDYWLLPGGGVEFGESLSAALEREVLEELGLTTAAGIPLALVESVSPDMKSYAKHVLHVILELETTAGQSAPRLVSGDPAVVEAGFFARQELSGLVIRPPILDFLDEYLRSPTDLMTYLGQRW